jgi:hypothetical protein
MTIGIIVGLVALAGFVSADFPDCVNGPVSWLHCAHEVFECDRFIFELANNTICDIKADPYTRATAVSPYLPPKNIFSKSQLVSEFVHIRRKDQQHPKCKSWCTENRLATLPMVVVPSMLRKTIH